MLELFDLEALVAAHPDDSQIADLAPTIRSAISASSVRNDLKRAAEMMAACKSLSDQARAAVAAGEGFTRETAATVQALFAQAVMLYTKGTHSDAKGGRYKLQIKNHLKDRPDLDAIHERITTLRDKYLGHFVDARGWEEHRAVLAIDMEVPHMALSYPHSSAYIRPEDAIEFEQLLAAAVPIAIGHFEKMSTRLNLALNALLDTRPDFLALLRGAGFDPASFFDPDEVGPYLASIGGTDPDPLTQPRMNPSPSLRSDARQGRKPR